MADRRGPPLWVVVVVVLDLALVAWVVGLGQRSGQPRGGADAGFNDSGPPQRPAWREWSPPWVRLPPRIALAELRVDGHLARKQIEGVLLQHFGGRWRLCYENTARNAPYLAGQIWTQLNLDSDGRVVDIITLRSDFDSHQDLVDCLTRGLLVYKGEHLVDPDSDPRHGLRGPGHVIFAVDFKPPVAQELGGSDAGGAD
jgi:hypothetical protein